MHLFVQPCALLLALDAAAAQVGGFSHKLGDLTRAVLDHMVQFADAVTQSPLKERLEDHKDKMRRGFREMHFEPTKQLSYLRLLVQQIPRFPAEDVIEGVDMVSVQGACSVVCLSLDYVLLVAS